MKTFKNQAAQGDMLIRRISSLPDTAKKIDAENGRYILAHSETGHNHVIKKQAGIEFYANDNDSFIAYLVVDNTKCLVEHERSFDTHDPIEIGDGVYEIRRQREYTPQGWRRAQD
jgi:hypothetical protein